MRRSMTLPEVLLWMQLKGKQMMGYDFHRQKPIDEYVVDFYCPKLKLVLETDGKYHAFTGEYDEKRHARLEALGLIVLRIAAEDVLRNMDGVLEWIKIQIVEIEKRNAADTKQ